jgi:hypothetical protein
MTIYLSKVYLPLFLSGSMFVFMFMSSRRASYPATAPQCRARRLAALAGRRHVPPHTPLSGSRKSTCDFSTQVEHDKLLTLQPLAVVSTPPSR